MAVDRKNQKPLDLLYLASKPLRKAQTCQPPKRANLETLQKSPEKPGDWDLKPGDFQNMCKMKIKMVDFLFQGILYLICATYCILLPHFLKSVSGRCRREAPV